MSSPYAPTDLRGRAEHTEVPPALAPQPQQAEPPVSPQVAQAAAQAAAQAKPTLTDTLADDARTAMAQTTDELPPWPAGAPRFRQIMKLPFRERAAVMRMYDEFLAMQSSLPDKGTTLSSPADAAQYYEVLAKLDDFMALCAHDAGSYRAWVGNADEKAFNQLWIAFSARMQLGEASSSSS